MAKPKPLIQVATICENVLTEPDKVSSVIRIVDTMYVSLPDGLQLAKGEVGAIQLKVFVSIKSGDVTGEFDLLVVLRGPSGKKAELPSKWHVSLLGGESGATLRIDFVLPVKEFGLYWFDVMWEGEVLTSIPLKLVEGQKPETEAVEKQKVSLA